jgi:hypothetical protein
MKTQGKFAPMAATAIVMVGAMTWGLAAAQKDAAPKDKSHDGKTIARYEAQAVDITAPAGRAAGPIEIQVTRWSTDAERQQLMTTVWEKGPEQLLDVLRKLPSVGVIRTPDTAGYDLRYARKTAMAGGDEQVVIATDRPIAFWEAATLSDTTRYPFVVIELHMHANGQGEGKMSVATKIDANKSTKTLTLQDYSAAPVQLQNVRLEK